MHFDVEDDSNDLVWKWNESKQCWELITKEEKEVVQDEKGKDS